MNSRDLNSSNNLRDTLRNIANDYNRNNPPVCQKTYEENLLDYIINAANMGHTSYEVETTSLPHKIFGKAPETVAYIERHRRFAQKHSLNFEVLYSKNWMGDCGGGHEVKLKFSW